jgi:hypothetical protein
MYQQLKQVRDYLELVDSPIPVELGSSVGQRPSAVGLPAELDEAEHALVVFLTTSCATCRTIAGNVGGGALPSTVWVVVEPSQGVSTEFLDEFDLHGPRVLLDEGSAVADALGVDVTPVGLTVRDGRWTEGRTIPSVRQLYAVTPEVTRTRVLTPRAEEREVSA